MSSLQALDGAIKQYKSLAPKTPVMFFSVDNDTGKILCMANVPKVGVETASQLLNFELD